MSTAICIATPLHFASSNPGTQLKLVVDNTSMPACCEAITDASTLPPREQNLKTRTAHTYATQINVGRPISREDQEQVMESIKKYGAAVLAVVFRGSTVQYAVNLRNVDTAEHETYPTAIRADIARVFPITQSFDTGRELTPERRKAITDALEWASHLITSISFDGKTVRYVITTGVADEKHYESVQRAIAGDIFMAARHGEWN